jgi:lipoprotein-anchoring transpeptidase ErfK/SrfK
MPILGGMRLFPICLISAASLCVLAVPAQAATPAGSTASTGSLAMTPSASWIATPAREPILARTEPRGGQVAMVLWKNLFTNAPTPTSLLVLGSETGPSGRVWVKMLLPKRPNGSIGWVPADQLVLKRTAWRVEISTTERAGRVFHHGRVVKRFPVVVGADSTPTPRGLTAIQDRRKQADPNGFYGPWILALDARSNAYQEFLGGPGTIAIHGAGAGNPLGVAISHGCIRVSPALDAWLGPRLVPGTPVAIDVPAV